MKSWKLQIYYPERDEAGWLAISPQSKWIFGMQASGTCLEFPRGKILACRPQKERERFRVPIGKWNGRAMIGGKWKKQRENIKEKIPRCPNVQVIANYEERKKWESRQAGFLSLENVSITPFFCPGNKTPTTNGMKYRNTLLNMVTKALKAGFSFWGNKTFEVNDSHMSWMQLHFWKAALFYGLSEDNIFFCQS